MYSLNSTYSDLQTFIGKQRVAVNDQIRCYEKGQKADALLQDCFFLHQGAVIVSIFISFAWTLDTRESDGSYSFPLTNSALLTCV